MSDFLDFKDEIIDGEPKYNIVDKDGNMINKNVFIDLANDIIESGTELNKNTSCKLNAIKGYNETTVERRLYKTEPDLLLGSVSQDKIVEGLTNMSPVILSNGNIMFASPSKVIIIDKEGNIITTKTYSDSDGLNYKAYSKNNKVYVVYGIYRELGGYDEADVKYKIYDENGDVLVEETLIQTESTTEKTPFTFQIIVDENEQGLITFSRFRNINVSTLYKYDFKNSTIIAQTPVSASYDYYPIVLKICKLNNDTLCVFTHYGECLCYRISDLGRIQQFDISSYDISYVHAVPIDEKRILVSYGYNYNGYKYTIRIVNINDETSNGETVSSIPVHLNKVDFYGKEYYALFMTDSVSFYKVTTSNTLSLIKTFELPNMNADSTVNGVSFKKEDDVFELVQYNYIANITTGTREFYENVFTTDYIQNSFRENEILKIHTPLEMDYDKVDKYSINGVNIITELLGKNKNYELIFNNDNFIVKENKTILDITLEEDGIQEIIADGIYDKLEGGKVYVFLTTNTGKTSSSFVKFCNIGFGMIGCSCTLVFLNENKDLVSYIRRNYNTDYDAKYLMNAKFSKDERFFIVSDATSSSIAESFPKGFRIIIREVC